MTNVKMEELQRVQTIGPNGIGVYPPIPVLEVDKVSATGLEMAEVQKGANILPHPGAVENGSVMMEKDDSWGSNGATLPDPSESADNMVLAVEDGKFVIADPSVNTDVVQYLAPPYSTETTYSKGECVVYDGNLYKAKQDIDPAEAWTAAHWEETTALDEITAKADKTDVDSQTAVTRAMMAPAEASATAASAHAVGSYFQYNGKLYKTTATISIGDTITPNTNCVEDTVGAELTSQSEQIEKLENIDGILKSNNLINYAKTETGSFNTNTGADNTDSGYYRTEYIPISANTNYVFTDIVNVSNGRYGFYTANKSFISQATLFSSTKNVAITTPANAKYVRIAVNKQITKSFWFGIANDKYSPYDYKGKSILENAKTYQGNLVRKKSENLLNGGDVHNGYLINWNNSNLRGQLYTDVLTSNASFFTSKPIPIENGKTYSSYYGAYLTARNTQRWFLLSNEYVLLDSLFDSQTFTVDNPYGAYLVISDTLSYRNNIFIKEGTTAPEYYQNIYYHERISDDSGYMLTKKDFSSWDGKKICGYGDSMTQWGFWLSDVAYWYNFDSYINNGMSGSRVSYSATATKWWMSSIDGKVYGSEQDYPESPADDAVLVNGCFCSADRINNLPNDIDIILVMGGTNDSANSVTIGTYEFGDTPDTSTFAGGLAETVRLMQTKFPNAVIVLMTCIFNASKDINPYNDAIKAVAKELALNVIDVHNCGINTYNASTKLRDGTHPTYNVQNSGAEMIMNQIIDGMKNIRPHYAKSYLT